jgi:hypothetical protein
VTIGATVGAAATGAGVTAGWGAGAGATAATGAGVAGATAPPRGQAMIAVAATPSTKAPPIHSHERFVRVGMRAICVDSWRCARGA